MEEKNPMAEQVANKKFKASDLLGKRWAEHSKKIKEKYGGDNRKYLTAEKGIKNFTHDGLGMSAIKKHMKSNGVKRWSYREVDAFIDGFQKTLDRIVARAKGKGRQQRIDAINDAFGPSSRVTPEIRELVANKVRAVREEARFETALAKRRARNEERKRQIDMQTKALEAKLASRKRGRAKVQEPAAAEPNTQPTGA